MEINGTVPKGDAVRDLGALPVFVGVEISLHQNGIHHSERQAEKEDSFV